MPFPSIPERGHERGQSRALAVGLSAGIEVGVALLLLFGLAPPSGLREAVHDSIAAITLTPPPLPPVKPPPPPHHHRPAGRASPPNLRAKAAPVLAVKLPLPQPVPIPVATKPAAVGTQMQSGAAPVPGPGTGAGGQGNGTGSGGNGNGDGDGGRDPEWVGGRIKSSDYPEAARTAGAHGTTSVTISVSAQGRPSGCRLVESSHNRDLDAATCDLVLKRFRFRPARDSAGHAVAGEVDYDQEWTLGILTDAP
ncbi:energy transducer TonB [Novosphingobium terrae]|uniref:energy transducer TonB n=1 Tax=Novosphingobium terrae TaxID=2726189 RepID=UPI00197E7D41|nr:energy transducer TonB [Novosphingobium terrae]